MSRNDIYDFGVQNVGNRNVQKRQINDFGVQNVGNRNFQKRKINDLGVQMWEIEMSKAKDK